MNEITQQPLNKTNKLKLFGIILIVLITGIGIHRLKLFKTNQNVNGSVLGQSVPATISVVPQQGILPPDLPISITLDAKTNKVAFVRLVLLFDQAKVNLTTEVSVSPLLGTIITKSS